MDFFPCKFLSKIWNPNTFLFSSTLQRVLSVLLTWTEIRKVQIAAYDWDYAIIKNYQLELIKEDDFE